MYLFFCWQFKSNCFDKVVIDYDSIKIDFPSCCVKDIEMDSFSSLLLARQTSEKTFSYRVYQKFTLILGKRNKMINCVSLLTTLNVNNHILWAAQLWTYLSSLGVNFINMFMHSFYAQRFQKCKMTYNLTVFFTLLGSTL